MVPWPNADDAEERHRSRGDLNGNGRAVLAPGALEPMRRYRQPEPPRRSTRRLLAQRLRLDRARAARRRVGSRRRAVPLRPRDAQRDRAALEGRQGVDEVPPPVPSPSQPATALIIGYDARAGADGFGASARARTRSCSSAPIRRRTRCRCSRSRATSIVPIYCDGPTRVYTHGPDQLRLDELRAAGTLDTVEKLTGVASTT